MKLARVTSIGKVVPKRDWQKAGLLVAGSATLAGAAPVIAGLGVLSAIAVVAWPHRKRLLVWYRNERESRLGKAVFRGAIITAGAFALLHAYGVGSHVIEWVNNTPKFELGSLTEGFGGVTDLVLSGVIGGLGTAFAYIQIKQQEVTINQELLAKIKDNYVGQHGDMQYTPANKRILQGAVSQALRKLTPEGQSEALSDLSTTLIMLPLELDPFAKSANIARGYRLATRDFHTGRGAHLFDLLKDRRFVGKQMRHHELFGEELTIDVSYSDLSYSGWYAVRCVDCNFTGANLVHWLPYVPGDPEKISPFHKSVLNPLVELGRGQTAISWLTGRGTGSRFIRCDFEAAKMTLTLWRYLSHPMVSDEYTRKTLEKAEILYEDPLIFDPEEIQTKWNNAWVLLYHEELKKIEAQGPTEDDLDFYAAERPDDPVLLAATNHVAEFANKAVAGFLGAFKFKSRSNRRG